MPAGFQSFNNDGSIKTDITTRFFRILGTISTGSTSGSRTDESLALGEAFFYQSSIADGSGNGIFGPSVTLSGITISWTFSVAGQQPTTIFYGVF